MKKLIEEKSCCQKEGKEKKGFLTGFLAGILPHTFCLLFIIFSVLGATTATTLLKPLLLNRYFFYLLIAISFLFATLSAIIYLKRNEILSFSGIKRKWKYLSILYGTTIFVNLLFFMVIFPYLANFNQGQSTAFIETSPLSSIILKVNIPCPGHAPLITGELKKIDGVKDVKFSFPNLFEISFDPQKTNREKILSLEIFKSFEAKVIKENFSSEPEKTLSEIYSAIEKAKEEGKYNCCINPPCTMCYLGNWIWERGTCQCDEMIKKGQLDKVCPQCLQGMKEGKCKSTTGACSL